MKERVRPVDVTKAKERLCANLVGCLKRPNMAPEAKRALEGEKTRLEEEIVNRTPCVPIWESDWKSAESYERRR